MKSNLTGRISRIACATLLAALGAFAQEHKWAGRELNELEWTIHETLEVAPSRVYSTVSTSKYRARMSR